MVRMSSRFPAENVAALAIRIAESGKIPDPLVRFGMNRVVESRVTAEADRDSAWRESFRSELWSGPVAIDTSIANEQHYDVPAEFFDIVLGSRKKYSSGYWPNGVTDIDSAELAMLELYRERAALEDGQRILDLGCGWGSFTIWSAEQFPRSEIVGVSNSASQKSYIERAARDAGLDNVRIVTADINDYQPAGQFDRVVSVEMLEHVRNHRELLRRMRSWLSADGAVFVHVFANKHHEYPYQVEGPGSWMADMFFTGGLMPSSTLIPDAGDPFFRQERSWWLDGTHYARTLEAWLSQFDEGRAGIERILEHVYRDDLAIWIQRWRMFFMACSEMFRYDNGSEWGVSHHLLKPR